MKEITHFDWITSDIHFGHYNVINYSNRPFKHEVKENKIYFKDQFICEELDNQSAETKARTLSVELMNTTIINNWNYKIKKEDIVIFNGDFAFLNQEKQKEIIAKLNGYKIAILGNHDSNEKTMLEIGFNEVYKEAKIKLKNKDVIISHYPYVDPELSHVANLRPNIIKIGKHKNIIKLPDNFDYTASKKWLKDNYIKPINLNEENGKEIFNFMKRVVSTHIGTRHVNEGLILIHGHTHSTKKRFANMINVSTEAWDYYPASREEIEYLVNEIELELNPIDFTINDLHNESYSYYEKFLKIKDFNVIKDLMHLMRCGDKITDAPQNYSQLWYKKAVELNKFIPKNKLKHLCFYKGTCRNADFAQWNEEKNCFIHLRNKWGIEYLEEIEAIEDDKGYDVFIPHEDFNPCEEDLKKFNI
jgi:calcineurin-like phosphoesterase family protein